MKRSILIAVMVCGAIFVGLMATNVQAFEILTKEDFVKEIVVTKHLIKVADNAIILFDDSGSMGKLYEDTKMTRYEIAKKTLMERNAYFPDIGYNFGLYTYSRWRAVYPVQPYNREKFAEALASLQDKPQGPTLLQSGLRKLESVLQNLSGRTVVFVLTDGTFTDMAGKRPGAMAKALAEKYDVCFCVVSTADDTASREVIKRVASVSPCSIGIPFKRFIGRPEYNSSMLYIVASTVDIKTTTETRAAGVKVDDILFDLDKADIRPEITRELIVLAEFLQENPDAYAVLVGYTCNLGSEEHNLGLSRRRAGIVAEYLRNNFNISPDRIVSLWFGELNSVADNSTEEGRRLNRRVEIAVGGI
jgi:OOP family OmpA-OmpF porin